jgi:hypothetical protein
MSRGLARVEKEATPWHLQALLGVLGEPYPRIQYIICSRFTPCLGGLQYLPEKSKDIASSHPCRIQDCASPLEHPWRALL